MQVLRVRLAFVTNPGKGPKRLLLIILYFFLVKDPCDTASAIITHSADEFIYHSTLSRPVMDRKFDFIPPLLTLCLNISPFPQEHFKVIPNEDFKVAFDVIPNLEPAPNITSLGIESSQTHNTRKHLRSCRSLCNAMAIGRGRRKTSPARCRVRLVVVCPWRGKINLFYPVAAGCNLLAGARNLCRLAKWWKMVVRSHAER